MDVRRGEETVRFLLARSHLTTLAGVEMSTERGASVQGVEARGSIQNRSAGVSVFSLFGGMSLSSVAESCTLCHPPGRVIRIPARRASRRGQRTESDWP